MARVRGSAALLLTAALAVTLVGCGGLGPVGPTSPTSPSATQPAAPSGGAVPSPTATPVPPAAGPACTRDNLTITYVATDNSAGHFHGVLDFGNRLGIACTMSGYPSVWFDNPEAMSPLGAQAAFDPASAPESVVLQPGGILQAELTITDAGVIECDHTTSVALLVAAPKDGPADFDSDIQHVPIDPTPACFGHDAALLVVGAVTIGPS